MVFDCHWCKLTVRTVDVEDLGLRLLLELPPSDGLSFDDAFEDHFEDCGRTSYYEHRYQGPYGIQLMAGNVGGSGEVLVEFKGETLEALGGAYFVHRVLAMLDDMGCEWRCTRFDGAWDHSDVSPALVHEAVMSWNVRTRLRRTTKTVGGDDERSVWAFHQNELGETAELGYRKASALLRVYNRRGYNRVECQFNQDRADFLAHALMRAPLDQWNAVCLGFLRNFVDFVDRPAESNINRAPLLSWWSQFVQGVARVKVGLAKLAKKMAECAALVVRREIRAAERLARQVARYKLCLGAHFDKLVEGAQLRPWDRLRITACGIAVERLASSSELSWSGDVFAKIDELVAAGVISSSSSQGCP